MRLAQVPAIIAPGAYRRATLHQGPGPVPIKTFGDPRLRRPQHVIPPIEEIRYPGLPPVVSPITDQAQGTTIGELVECSENCAWYIPEYGCAIKALGEIAAKKLAKN
jgi:hypothetical protein